MKLLHFFLTAVVLAAFPAGLTAQIDPEPRHLIHLGYDQPLVGRAPFAGYGYYYLNRPGFLRTNLTLRMALAPVYMDSELGIKEALGSKTDLGLGLSGGGYADSYSEFRLGKWMQEESFIGHGLGASMSLYHWLMPMADHRGVIDSLGEVPLCAVARVQYQYSAYNRAQETSPAFVLPGDRSDINVRTGFRWGGLEPVLISEMAMELSAWYEGQFRMNPGTYGLGRDREVEKAAHLFWARMILDYTFPANKTNQHLSLSLVGGSSLSADRFSAYRLGGFLPLASEFPLSIPGYFYQEISARQFVLMGGLYSVAWGAEKQWAIVGGGAVAGVQYLRGMNLPHAWNTGIGAGLCYRTPSERWKMILGYGYGFQAQRGQDEGGHNINLLIEVNLEKARAHRLLHQDDPNRSRGLHQILNRWLD